ncbi:hypothetical protein BLA29_000166 [Euroglyphus maynei]|uniref:Uncharacterized protein n=1 Tax=Euroglyphus maynei TaxID=6958 RepID=A0A1Y3BLV1_EURMA|nr:hypothetical protein BLA29_000166 [Euroglyphus maynei]
MNRQSNRHYYCCSGIILLLNNIRIEFKHMCSLRSHQCALSFYHSVKLIFLVFNLLPISAI